MLQEVPIITIYSNSDPNYYANDNDPTNYAARFGIYGPVTIHWCTRLWWKVSSTWWSSKLHYWWSRYWWKRIPCILRWRCYH